MSMNERVLELNALIIFVHKKKGQMTEHAG